MDLESFKTTLFVVLDECARKIYLQAGVYAGFINLNDKMQIEKLTGNNVIFLQFENRDSRDYFAKYDQCEVSDNDVIEMCQRLVEGRLDLLVKY